MRYEKVATCPNCSFQHRQFVEVWGDFDGWDEQDLTLKSKSCPFCNHALKLGLYRKIISLIKQPKVK